MGDEGGDVYFEAVVDVSGWSAMGGLGDPLNSSALLEGTVFIPNVEIAAVCWDIRVEAAGNSWVSDVGLSVSSGSESIEFFPGDGLAFPGFEDISHPSWLIVEDVFGEPFYVSEGGTWLEFFDVVDNVFGTELVFAEGSSITFGLQVPSPGTGVVMGVGVCAMVRRRR